MKELKSAFNDYKHLQNYFADLLINRVEAEEARVVEKQVKPLKMSISDVSPTGNLTISYNKPVKARIVGQKIPNFLLNVRVLQNSDEHDLQMSFEVTKFTEMELGLQLKFDQPKLVSQGY